MRILIVAADDAVLSVLAEELKRLGYEVITTHFGDEGLSLFKKNRPFAIVLSDYRFLPGVEIEDGVQLLTAIGEINPLQQMAIMTAEVNEVRRNLREAPLRSLLVLRKP